MEDLALLLVIRVAEADPRACWCTSRALKQHRSEVLVESETPRVAQVGTVCWGLDGVYCVYCQLAKFAVPEPR